MFNNPFFNGWSTMKKLMFIKAMTKSRPSTYRNADGVELLPETLGSCTGENAEEMRSEDMISGNSKNGVDDNEQDQCVRL